jgi:predicted MPP superfamily phosphohydrolase
VPGNHDYWSHAPFEPIAKCFAKTGGAWLLDEAAVCLNGKVNIIGASCASAKKPLPATRSNTRNVLLIHYPAWVKQLGESKYDLILAGHSHGGQVRIPFYGPIMTPFGVDEYDLGLFHTPVGPLYVNPGIGWFYAPLRFRCRPELTLFEL